MSKKIFVLLLLVTCMLLPVVTSKPLSSLRGITVFTTADNYKIEGIPIIVHTTSFGKYCDLCDQDSACCVYCDAPNCKGLVRETYPEGSIAEGISNLRFENDFEVKDGSSLCPAVSVKKGDSCSGKWALERENDQVWFSIEGYEYTSTKYDLIDAYNSDRWRYEIKESFKLSELDRVLIEKTNGETVFATEPSEPVYNGNIIPAEDIEFIIPANKAVEMINETVDDSNVGVVVLKKEARDILREKAKISAETIVGLVVIIALVTVLVIYLNKKIKKR